MSTRDVDNLHPDTPDRGTPTPNPRGTVDPAIVTVTVPAADAVNVRDAVPFGVIVADHDVDVGDVVVLGDVGLLLLPHDVTTRASARIDQRQRERVMDASTGWIRARRSGASPDRRRRCNESRS